MFVAYGIVLWQRQNSGAFILFYGLPKQDPRSNHHPLPQFHPPLYFETWRRFSLAFFQIIRLKGAAQKLYFPRHLDKEPKSRAIVHNERIQTIISSCSTGGKRQLGASQPSTSISLPTDPAATARRPPSECLPSGTRPAPPRSASAPNGRSTPAPSPPAAPLLSRGRPGPS